MDLKELRTLVRQGEGFQLEFKLKATHPEKIVREMVAFANSGGGKLLVGIADDKSIQGVKFGEEEEFVLTRAIEKYCHPQIPYSLEKLVLPDEREVLIYTIAPSENKPHYVRPEQPETPGKVYVRVEDRTVQASKEMREVLKGERKQRGYRFQFGEKEKMLMQYLGLHPFITVDGFASLAAIPRQAASRTLVLLVLANVLAIQPEEEEDFFFRNEISEAS
jgi:predicted HTH transcriptional regulator